MKKSLLLLAFALVVAASMQAATKRGFQSATVVSVDSYDSPSNTNYAGSNPSDAPLQSAVVYSYDIGIRLGCTVYRARYDSAFDSLPEVFSVNHKVEVNLHKRVIEVSLPGNHDVQMGIGGRKSLNGRIVQCR
jgi:hypothetical protein